MKSLLKVHLLLQLDFLDHKWFLTSTCSITLYNIACEVWNHGPDSYLSTWSTEFTQSLPFSYAQHSGINKSSTSQVSGSSSSLPLTLPCLLRNITSWGSRSWETATTASVGCQTTGRTTLPAPSWWAWPWWRPSREYRDEGGQGLEK